MAKKGKRAKAAKKPVQTKVKVVRGPRRVEVAADAHPSLRRWVQEQARSAAVQAKIDAEGGPVRPAVPLPGSRNIRPVGSFPKRSVQLCKKCESPMKLALGLLKCENCGALYPYRPRK